MARGWDSKSVEEAQLQAEASLDERRNAPRPKTQEDRQKEVELESLQLSRSRLMRDIGATQSDRYRAQLQAGLTHIEQKLAALGWTPIE